MKEKVKELRVQIDDFPIYEIGITENVYSLARKVYSPNYKNGYRITKEITLKPNTDKNGYLYVVLQQDKRKVTKKIHRLIAEAFIPNPDNLPQINHGDGDKLNNAIFNLEWCTSLTNVRHSLTNDLRVKKLTSDDVREIRSLIGTIPQKDIAKRFNVHNSMISGINKGKYHGARS